MAERMLRGYQSDIRPMRTGARSSSILENFGEDGWHLEEIHPYIEMTIYLAQ